MHEHHRLPFQNTSFRSVQEEKLQRQILFALSVPKYKPTERACSCRLNAESLDRWSVENHNNNNLRKLAVTMRLINYYTLLHLQGCP